MERNTVASIEELNIGDRFYKANDKNKEVWEKVEHDKKQTYYQTYRNFATKHGDRNVYAFKKETQVIYLRSKKVFSEDNACD